MTISHILLFISNFAIRPDHQLATNIESPLKKVMEHVSNTRIYKLPKRFAFLPAGWQAGFRVD